MARVYAVTFLTLLTLAAAPSLPRFAMITGARCSSCHVNPGGGGMRNRHGLTFGIGALTMSAHDDSADTDDGGVFDPRLGESVTLGGDLRTQYIGESAGGTSTFHMMTASLYGNVRLSRDISANARFDLVNAAYGERSGPEVFVLARVLPGRWYLKGGDFLPAFGTRIDDHTAYTRGGDLGSIPGAVALPGLLFTPNYKDIGLEVGGTAGDLEISAAVMNGTGNAVRLDFRDAKAFIVRLEYAASVSGVNLVVGSSGYHFDAYRMGGVHAGIGADFFALYGEADFTKNRIAFSGFSIDRSADQMAAFLAADVRIVRGIWFTGKVDRFDPARGTPSDEFTRYTLGLELFPWPFIELRPQLRLAAEPADVDNNSALLQLHAWF